MNMDDSLEDILVRLPKWNITLDRLKQIILYVLNNPGVRAVLERAIDKYTQRTQIQNCDSSSSGVAAPTKPADEVQNANGCNISTASNSKSVPVPTSESKTLSEIFSQKQSETASQHVANKYSISPCQSAAIQEDASAKTMNTVEDINTSLTPSVPYHGSLKNSSPSVVTPEEKPLHHPVTSDRSVSSEQVETVPVLTNGTETSLKDVNEVEGNADEITDDTATISSGMCPESSGKTADEQCLESSNKENKITDVNKDWQEVNAKCILEKKKNQRKSKTPTDSSKATREEKKCIVLDDEVGDKNSSDVEVVELQDSDEMSITSDRHEVSVERVSSTSSSKNRKRKKEYEDRTPKPSKIQETRSLRKELGDSACQQILSIGATLEISSNGQKKYSAIDVNQETSENTVSHCSDSLIMQKSGEKDPNEVKSNRQKRKKSDFKSKGKKVFILENSSQGKDEKNCKDQEVYCSETVTNTCTEIQDSTVDNKMSEGSSHMVTENDKEDCIKNSCHSLDDETKQSASPEKDHFADQNVGNGVQKKNVANSFENVVKSVAECFAEVENTTDPKSDVEINSEISSAEMYKKSEGTEVCIPIVNDREILNCDNKENKHSPLDTEVKQIPAEKNVKGNKTVDGKNGRKGERKRKSTLENESILKAWQNDSKESAIGSSNGKKRPRSESMPGSDLEVNVTPPSIVEGSEKSEGSISQLLVEKNNESSEAACEESSTNKNSNSDPEVIPSSFETKNDSISSDKNMKKKSKAKISLEGKSNISDISVKVSTGKGKKSVDKMTPNVHETEDSTSEISSVSENSELSAALCHEKVKPKDPEINDLKTKNVVSKASEENAKRNSYNIKLVEQKAEKHSEGETKESADLLKISQSNEKQSSECQNIACPETSSNVTDVPNSVINVNERSVGKESKTPVRKQKHNPNTVHYDNRKKENPSKEKQSSRKASATDCSSFESVTRGTKVCAGRKSDLTVATSVNEKLVALDTSAVKQKYSPYTLCKENGNKENPSKEKQTSQKTSTADCSSNASVTRGTKTSAERKSDVALRTSISEKSVVLELKGSAKKQIHSPETVCHKTKKKENPSKDKQLTQKVPVTDCIVSEPVTRGAKTCAATKSDVAKLPSSVTSIYEKVTGMEMKATAEKHSPDTVGHENRKEENSSKGEQATRKMSATNCSDSEPVIGVTKTSTTRKLDISEVLSSLASINAKSVSTESKTLVEKQKYSPYILCSESRKKENPSKDKEATQISAADCIGSEPVTSNAKTCTATKSDITKVPSPSKDKQLNQKTPEANCSSSEPDTRGAKTCAGRKSDVALFTSTNKKSVGAELKASTGEQHSPDTSCHKNRRKDNPSTEKHADQKTSTADCIGSESVTSDAKTCDAKSTTQKSTGWTREQDKEVLVTCKTLGTTNETFLKLAKSLYPKTPIEVKKRFYELLEIYRKALKSGALKK